MDNRTFVSRVAKAAGCDIKTAAANAAALAEAIAEATAEMDSTAIPGFGTFEAVKTPDHIITDPDTNTTKLVPPTITVNFKPGSRLKKAVSK